MTATIYGSTHETIVTFERVNCYKCAIPFYVPKKFDDARLKDQESFYCPEGHRQHYVGKTKEQRLRESNERLSRELSHQRELTQAARNRERGQKAAKTRIKNRIKNGVCPCCNRTFADLARHMASKHPGFQPEADQE